MKLTLAAELQLENARTRDLSGESRLVGSPWLYTAEASETEDDAGGGSKAR